MGNHPLAIASDTSDRPQSENGNYFGLHIKKGLSRGVARFRVVVSIGPMFQRSPPEGTGALQ